MQPDPDLALIFRYVMPIIGFVSVVLAVMVPASIAFVKVRKAKAVAEPAQMNMLESKLERIESAVEAIAIEVERISEAQRFSAKLQAESYKLAQIASKVDG
jgi:hypothetical protein